MRGTITSLAPGQTHRELTGEGECFQLHRLFSTPCSTTRFAWEIKWLTGVKAGTLDTKTEYQIEEYCTPTDDTTTPGDEWLESLDS